MTSREVTQRIRELILDDGYKSFDKLPDDLKDELTALSIRGLGRHAYEVLVEGNDTDSIIDDLVWHLLNGTVESAERLGDTMRKNARDYFIKGLEELFDECYGELECEHKREAGLHPITDHINGEIRWVR